MISFEDRKVENDMSIRGKAQLGIFEFSFWALLFDEPGEYGIEGGRISKLTIKSKQLTGIFPNGIVWDYDRGFWNTTSVYHRELRYIIKELEVQPKKFKPYGSQ